VQHRSCNWGTASTAAAKSEPRRSSHSGAPARGPARPHVNLDGVLFGAPLLHVPVALQLSNVLSRTQEQRQPLVELLWGDLQHAAPAIAAAAAGLWGLSQRGLWSCRRPQCARRASVRACGECYLALLPGFPGWAG
jgi:hypothetical protein